MRLSRSIILSAALVLPIGAAQAGVISPQGLGAALEQHGLVDQVAYRYGGREYCWYPSGWHGAGWYWCGYRLRVGHGWGGPAGWHGWNARERVGTFEERGRIDRRGSAAIREDRRGSAAVREDRRGAAGLEQRSTSTRTMSTQQQRGRMNGPGAATTGQGTGGAGPTAPGGVSGGGQR